MSGEFKRVPSPSSLSLEKLMAEAKARGPYTPTSGDRLDWVYGNLAASTNHKPQRAAFAQVATRELGMTPEAFEAWAAGREWAPDAPAETRAEYLARRAKGAGCGP